LPDYFLTDMAKAKQQAAAKNKPILTVFSTSWCAPCQAMVKNLYPLAEVKKGLADYVCVYVDGDKEKTIMQKYKIEGFPTFVVIDKDGRELGRFIGAKHNANDFLKAVQNALTSVAERKHTLAMLDKTINEAPTLDAYAKRAAIREDENDFAGAIADYKEAAKLDKDDSFQIKGDIAYVNHLSASVDAPKNKNKAENIEKLKKDRDFLKKFLRDYPKCSHISDAQIELIGVYDELEDPENAIAVANVFLEKYPDHPDARIIQAYVMFQQLMSQAAIQKNIQKESKKKNK